MIKLRDYQIDMISKARAALIETKKIVIVLATGGGKTAIASFMLKGASEKNHICWFVVNRIELIDQSVLAFERIGVKASVIASGRESEYDPKNKIQVVMIQTAIRKLKKLQAPSFLVIDECHFSIAPTYDKLFSAYPDAYRIGLTATPDRIDSKGLGRSYDKMVLGVDAEWLIQNKYLSDFKVYGKKLVDTSKVKISMGDFDAEDFELHAGSKFIGDVLNEYKQKLLGKKAIIFAMSVKSSMAFEKLFNENGISCAHIDAEISREKRKEIISKFKSGEIRVLTNYSIVTYGFDCPDCDAVILARPTLSVSLYLQAIGRALRVSDTKTHAIILDHVGNVERHGFPDDKRNWTLDDKQKKAKKIKEEKIESVVICNVCFYANKSSNIFCEGCEIELPKKEKKDLQHVNEELVLLEKQNKTLERKNAKTLDDLLKIEKLRGYKRGWAYHVYKSRKNKSKNL